MMGGVHASILPDEALRFVDTVVIGEAEGVWAKVISDFENQNLQQSYKAELLEFKGWPIPRHDLFHKGYAFDSIQTTRGCPMQCDFCSVSLFNGFTYSQRPIDEVIEELKMIKRKLLFILDDNILGNNTKNEQRTIELFKRMNEENIKKDWFSHASINFANNEEVLKLAAASGCKLIFIGFEAEKKEQLADMNKTQNIKTGVNNYKKILKKINKHKIGVIGSYIMGLDSDSLKDLMARKRFLLKNDLNIIGVSRLTPFPGTILYKRMEQENRITRKNYPEDWQHYDLFDVVFKPKKMTEKELDDFVIETMKTVYNPFHIFMRTIIALFRTKSIKVARWVLNSNLHHRNLYKK